jgi:hypothetical protein
MLGPAKPLKPSVAFIRLAWIPAGLLGLFIAEKLPTMVRLPFLVLMIAGIIYYRFFAAKKLKERLMGGSKH